MVCGSSAAAPSKRTGGGDTDEVRGFGRRGKQRWEGVPMRSITSGGAVCGCCARRAGQHRSGGAGYQKRARGE